MNRNLHCSFGVCPWLTFPSKILVNMTKVGTRPSHIILQKSSRDLSVGPSNAVFFSSFLSLSSWLTLCSNVHVLPLVSLEYILHTHVYYHLWYKVGTPLQWPPLGKEILSLSQGVCFGHGECNLDHGRWSLQGGGHYRGGWPLIKEGFHLRGMFLITST